MDCIDRWPSPLLAFLDRAYGTPLAVEQLIGGRSPALVSRVRFADRSIVIKETPRTKEAIFYEQVAD